MTKIDGTVDNTKNINKILLVGTQAAYDALGANIDENKLYFCSDTMNIYKGSVLYTDGIRKVASRPAKPAVGKLYFVTDAGTLDMYDGTEWTVVRPAVVEYTEVDGAQTSGITSASTNAQIPTALAVYQFVTGMIDDLASSENTVAGISATKDVDGTPTTAKAGNVFVAKGDGSVEEVEVPGVVTSVAQKMDGENAVAGTLSVTTTDGKGTGTAADVQLKGVAVNPTWNATTRTLTIPVAGGATVTAEIGKDIFIDPTASNGYDAETGNIVLYLNDGKEGTDPTAVTIPAASLVAIYEGKDTDTVDVTVTYNSETKKYEIKNDVKIDTSKTNNGLQSNANGLFVDMTAVVELQDAFGFGTF